MLTSLTRRSVQIFKAIGYHLLSPSCIICHLPSQRKLDFCRDCEQNLPHVNNACPQCALPLNETHHALRCANCLQRSPSFDRTIALYHYQAPVDQLINQLKFHYRLANAVVFGKLLAANIHRHYQAQTLPELIIPIPLHKKRLRQRGFNQAVEIAKIVGSSLNIKLDRFCSVRTRDTRPQSLLTATERRHNLKAAFSVKKNNLAKHVAVLDDVMTTAATVNEFCQSLRQAGVEQIDVWCVARTKIR